MGPNPTLYVPCILMSLSSNGPFPLSLFFFWGICFILFICFFRLGICFFTCFFICFFFLGIFFLRFFPGGFVLCRRCRWRYEISRFYYSSNCHPPPHPPSPQPPTPPHPIMSASTSKQIICISVLVYSISVLVYGNNSAG